MKAKTNMYFQIEQNNATDNTNLLTPLFAAVVLLVDEAFGKHLFDFTVDLTVPVQVLFLIGTCLAFVDFSFIVDLVLTVDTLENSLFLGCETLSGLRFFISEGL